MMRILVTGGAGFVGSHLVDRLLMSGHQVAVLDNLSTGFRHNISPSATFIHYDIRSSLDDVFSAIRPEVIYHLAAQVSVPRSQQDPASDLSVNVGGAVNLMCAAAKIGVHKVVSMSSAAVYGVPKDVPLTERSQVQPISPYGLSKLTGERYIGLLGESLSLAYTIIRPANVYGPRQTTEGEGAVVPAFLNQFLKSRDPVIHGTGEQIRDFVHVADVVNALESAMLRGDGRILNVSGGIGTSINSLWRTLASLIGWTRQPQHGTPRAGDIPVSILSNDQAKQVLNWTPTVKLTAGLAETLGWRISSEAAIGRL